VTTTWILIVVWMASGVGTTSLSIEFSSQRACEAAATAAHKLGAWDTHVYQTCVQK
jgi:hypothetical protein